MSSGSRFDMGQPSIDVIVLNYNGRVHLEKCLPSLMASTYSGQKIFVIDNCSTDNDPDWIRTHFPSVEVIQNTSNNGYCAAYNLAINSTSSPYLICLNNDVTVEPGWLEPLVDMMEKDNEIAACQPKLVSYFDRQMFEYAGAAGGEMDKYGYPFLRGRLFDTLEPDHGQYNTVKEIFWASGAALVLRRDALNRTGLFDETIVHHMDEIDLCWRILLAGMRIVVVPDSVIHHIGGATIPGKSYKKTYWNHRNSIYMMLKNYSFINNIFRTIPHILLDYPVILRGLFQGDLIPLRAIMAAHFWNLFHLGTIYRKRKEVKKFRTKSDREIDKYIYQGSVVFEYFILKHKTYNTLKNI